MQTRTASKHKRIKSRFRSANRSSKSIKLTGIAIDYRILIAYDIAQPANKRTPLEIDVFWDKPTPEPPLRWEKRKVKYKLALLAKYNIITNTLLGPKPEIVDLPFEVIYAETIVGSSAQSERERKARNAQQKMNGQNKCPRMIEIGIMCEDEPWPNVIKKRSHFST